MSFAEQSYALSMWVQATVTTPVYGETTSRESASVAEGVSNYEPINMIK